MAKAIGKPIDQAADQGVGLAFVAYPEAVSRMPISRLWAVLFFTMLCTLGFGTQFTLIESVVSTITETMYSSPNRAQKRRVLFLTVLFFFACGMVLCTQVCLGMHTRLDTLLCDKHRCKYICILLRRG